MKSETLNKYQILMSNISNLRVYNLFRVSIFKFRIFLPACSYTKSSGESPLSSKMLLKTLGWRIFAPWKGTVARFPSIFLKILWLQFWRTRTKPFFSKVEIACLAVMRGKLGILVSDRNFYRGKNYVFWLSNLLLLGRHIFKIKLDCVMDVCKRLFIGIAL